VRRRLAARRLAAAASLVASACGGTGPSEAPGDAASGTPAAGVSGLRPDVILVTLDTTRAERLGCYGNPVATSPNLDALAAEGVRFDLAVSASAVTPVSHASILTGLDPYHHGLRVMYAASGRTLPANVPTLATTLAAAGWRTGAFLSAFPVSEAYGFDRGFARFDNGLRAPAEAAIEQDVGGHVSWDVRTNQRRSDETVDAALAWIAGQNGPLFAWVHLWDPHDPWILPPEETLARFGASRSDDPARSEEVYAAEIFHMDAQVGRLLSGLREMGRYDRAVVVVVADHGQGLADGLARHGWWLHRLLYQEQIRVPLLVRLPGTPSGRVVLDLVRTTDIFPTVLEAVSVAPTAPVDGISLGPLIRGETEAPRLAYAEQLNLWDLDARMVETRPEDDLLYCMMDRSWKLIYRPRRPDRSELYDLASDPLETRNRQDDRADEVRRLRDRLLALDPFVDAPFPATPGTAPVDEDTRKRLEALGYTGG